ncbi:unnamed protein product [Candidula unifasciata]|uniref:Elongation of very long chain fatty acids protein n=1 Tax=Candidula unifasciata TaxID=100452 RepID=A0A8S3Z761_9EUPU|nr:unnamed protein product [Candidula unifasciata]
MANAITATEVFNFLKMIGGLPSLSLFVGYMMTFFISGLWQRWTAPFDVKSAVIVHHFACCLASAVAFCGFCYCLFQYGSIYGRTPDALLEQFFKLYWIIKTFELLDTVFMVLCHQQPQISYFHVYQHASLLLLSDMARLFYPWQSIAAFLTVNSLAHFFQYLYLGLSHVNPNEASEWRKTAAQVQLFQHFVILFLAVNGYRHRNFCAYCVGYATSLLVLCLNFYFHEFFKRPPPRIDLRRRQ